MGQSLGLYQLTQQAKEVISFLDDEEMDEQAIIDTVEGIEGEIDVKADGYCKILAMMDGRKNTIEAEIERLKNLKAFTEKRENLLKNLLFNSMKATGRTEINTGAFKIKIVNNGGVLPLEIDDGQVPKEYYKTVITEVVDKDKIRETLKTQYLPFARLGERGQRLSIK